MRKEEPNDDKEQASERFVAVGRTVSVLTSERVCETR
jgi:hypothetical protein